MIPVEYYSVVYFLTLSFAVGLIALPLLKYHTAQSYASTANNWYSNIILVITILFIGLRDPWGSSRYLGDTGAYSRMFSSISLDKLSNSKDFGFDLFMYLCAQVMIIEWFYFLCAVLYVGLPYLAFRKWFSNKAWIALLVYVTAMSFWAFGINGLRNGLGAAFFIYGISFVKQPVKMAIWFVLAISFHKSMLLTVGAFILTHYVTNTLLLIRIWLTAIPIAFFFGDSLETSISFLFEVSGFDDKRVENLLVNELDGEQVSRGFRLDFVLYSSASIILGYYYTIKKNYNDVLYTRFLNTYLIANTVWVLMIYVTFTNRTAYLSWLIMPVVLVYPLLKSDLVRKQSHWLFLIIFGNLLFTLLLFFR